MAISTKERQQLLRFPKLGIRIKIERPDDSTTLVDVNLPKNFVSDGLDESRFSISSDPDLRHAICNRLHVAMLSLEILESHSADDSAEDVERALEIALESLFELETLL